MTFFPFEIVKKTYPTIVNYSLVVQSFFKLTKTYLKSD